MDWLSLERLSTGRVLRLRRVRLGLSQQRLADLAGVHPSLVSDLERDTPPASRPAGQLAAARAKLDAALTPLETGWHDVPACPCNATAAQEPADRDQPLRWYWGVKGGRGPLA